MTTYVTLIPLAAIEAEALPRDRTATCPEALAELQCSILAPGLRQPIEVFAAEPASPAPLRPHLRLPPPRPFRALAPAAPTSPAAPAAWPAPAPAS